MSNHTQIGFEGDVIIVTGAGGGLGRSHALALAKRGARVVVNDVGGTVDGEGSDSKPAEMVVEEIRAKGGEAVADFTDISIPNGGDILVHNAVSAFDRIDGVVNNAGILRDGMHHKSTARVDDKVLGVHLHGSFHVTRAAMPYMREQGYGRVVVTTSAAGLFGNVGQANYGAAKMGLVGFMKALALEGALKGVMVNAIAPVGDTRMTQGILPDELLPELAPEHVSAVVTLLMNKVCPVTGKIFSVTGRHVGEVKVVETVGWTNTDALTPEDVLINLDAITNDSVLNAHSDMTTAVMSSAAQIAG
jgi:NAD(P)-dependent dehydrogenase (short-subunit alcohol dehydrogenase family)